MDGFVVEEKENMGGENVSVGCTLSLEVTEIVFGAALSIDVIPCNVMSDFNLGSTSDFVFPKVGKLNVGFGGIGELDRGRDGVACPLSATKGSTAGVGWFSGLLAPGPLVKSKADFPPVPKEPVVVVFELVKSNFGGNVPLAVGKLGFPNVEPFVLESDKFKTNGEGASVEICEGVG